MSKEKEEEMMSGINLTHEEIQKLIAKKCDELKEFLLKKNEEYNDSSFKAGLIFNYARISDKVDRYEVMIKKIIKGEKIHWEGIGDTIKDIGGYGIIGSIIYDVKHSNDGNKSK